MNIIKYYDFILNCTDKGFHEHYMTGVIITLLVCIVIFAFAVQVEKKDKSFVMFVTAACSIIFSFAWPLIIFILAGIVLPFALIMGMIYSLSKIISYMSMSKH